VDKKFDGGDKVMAVSEEDVKEEEIIQSDFRRAREFVKKVRKEFGYTALDENIAFLLTLIYCRQLKHYMYEESHKNEQTK